MFINKQNQTGVAFIEALQEFQEAIIGGYRLPENFSPNTWPHISQVNTNYARIGITLEKCDNQEKSTVSPAVVEEAMETLKEQLEVNEEETEEVVEEVQEEPVEEVITEQTIDEATIVAPDKPVLPDDLSKKVDLLDWAKQNGIVVPDNLVQASAVKKYLKSL